MYQHTSINVYPSNLFLFSRNKRASLKSFDFILLRKINFLFQKISIKLIKICQIENADKVFYFMFLFFIIINKIQCVCEVGENMYMYDILKIFSSFKD